MNKTSRNNKATRSTKKASSTTRTKATRSKATTPKPKATRSKATTRNPKATRSTKKALSTTRKPKATRSKATTTRTKATRSKTKKPSSKKGATLSKGYVIGPFRYKVNPKGGIKPLMELDRENAKVKYEPGKGAIYKGSGTSEDPIIIEQSGPNGDNVFIDLTKDVVADESDLVKAFDGMKLS